MEHQSEDKLRNELNPEGDSLAEKKKIENGVDIEPEADDWIAKPVAGTESELNSKKD